MPVFCQSRAARRASRRTADRATGRQCLAHRAAVGSPALMAEILILKLCVTAGEFVILLHPAEAKRCFVISRNVTKFQWQKQKVPWLQKRPFLPLLLLLSCHLYTRKMFRLQFYNSQRTGSLPLAQHLQLAKLKDWTMLLACPAPTIYLLRTSHSERHHLLRNVCHCDFLLVSNTIFLRIWNTAFTCWFQAQDQLKTINDSLISRSITMLQKDIFGGRKTLTINWK